ncbi:DUF5753 domain-containing protein [Streptomyces sparsogenes]|uniref:DUF5753 domain-containing protein n=1 Tax=Streptomyces sparsogenes TaxID=67365 RepID=UPI00332EF0B6
MGLKASYGQQYVAKVEAGERLASPEFADACDRVVGTPGTFAPLRKRASQHGYPEWFVPYVQLERQATEILDYSATLIMGMLQTKEYASAVFRSGYPREAEEVISAKVERRFQGRELMERDAPPLLWCVLNEACLRAPVGGEQVMRAQMEYLVTAATSPHVTLQVLPFAAGAPPAAESFTLLTFDEGPKVVYVDTAMVGQLIDSAEAVAKATATYDRLRAAALHPEASLSMIRRLMEEYT